MKRPHDAIEGGESSMSPDKTPRLDPFATVKHSQHGAAMADANDQNPAVFDNQMRRSVCVALQNAGFTSVKKEALDTFGLLLDDYMRSFSQHVTVSMKSSRRTQPVPQDFVWALKSHNLTPKSLAPQLDIACPSRARGKSKPSGKPTSPQLPRTKQPQLRQQDPSENTLSAFPHPSKTPNATLNEPLRIHSDEQNRQKKRPVYVPAHMPVFPAPHTYIYTPSAESQRENDSRKIRQLATNEGVLAEKALRKLMAAKSPRKNAVSQPGARRHEEKTQSRRTLREQYSRSEGAFMAALSAAESDATVDGKPLAVESDLEIDLGDEAARRPGTNDDSKTRTNGEGKAGLGDTDLGVSVNWDVRNWRNVTAGI